MAGTNATYMKVIDVVAATLLFIGGINWGLVGLADFNLVEYIFSGLPAAVRVVYLLVGLGALYDALMWTSIQRRWECTGFFGRAESMGT